MVMPGVFGGDQDLRMLGVARGVEAVLPITIQMSQRGCIALEIHHLRPLSTYSSPSGVIDSSRLVASDEATCGSVIT
jgi:hypothetical protein